MAPPKGQTDQNTPPRPHTIPYTHPYIQTTAQSGARGKREKRVLVTKRLDESPEGAPLKFAVIDNPVWLQDHEWCVVGIGDSWGGIGVFGRDCCMHYNLFNDDTPSLPNTYLNSKFFLSGTRWWRSSRMGRPGSSPTGSTSSPSTSSIAVRAVPCSPRVSVRHPFNPKHVDPPISSSIT